MSIKSGTGAETEKTKVTISVDGELFSATGTVMKSLGWYAVYAKTKADSAMPPLMIGEALGADLKISEGKTDPPKRFTDKTLCAAMKSAGKQCGDDELKKILDDPSVQGIGTEATRAGIVEGLIRSGYIERKRKQITPTEKGMKLIEILPFEELKSAELTAIWEKDLSKISKGEMSCEEYVRRIEEKTLEWINAAPKEMTGAGFAHKDAIAVCPLCGGSIIAYKWGWGCSNYKAGCKFGVKCLIAGKRITEKNIKEIATTGKTRFLKGFKKKDGSGTYEAALCIGEDGRINFCFPERKKR